MHRCGGSSSKFDGRAIQICEQDNLPFAEIADLDDGISLAQLPVVVATPTLDTIEIRAQV